MTASDTLAAEIVADRKWASIPTWEGLYVASDDGLVLSLARMSTGSWQRQVPERLLKQKLNRAGYYVVTLYRDAVRHYISVHILVASAFHGTRPESAECVRHLNGNSRDNRAVNVAWGTHKENYADQIRHGTAYYRPQEVCPRGHQLGFPNFLPAAQTRQCLACSRANHDVRNARVRGAEPVDFVARAEYHFARIMATGSPIIDPQTHCGRKHPLSGPNLRINKTTGSRQCISCLRATHKASNARGRGIELDLQVQSDLEFDRIMATAQTKEAS